MFQFQYGSIRSMLLGTGALSVTAFQFQYGSIRRKQL